MRTSIMVALLCLLAMAVPARAESPEQSAGQLVYVPAYAHIYYGNANMPFYLTVTLSVRNTNLDKPITVTTLEYYDTAGTLMKRFLDKPVVLTPLETMEIVIQEKGKEGGSGDNFLVRWKASQPVNPPIIEAVMIGTASGQGISFTSRGVPLHP